MTQFEDEFVSLELCGAVALYPEHCQNCSQGGMLAAFFEWSAIQQHSLIMSEYQRRSRSMSILASVTLLVLV